MNAQETKREILTLLSRYDPDDIAVAFGELLRDGINVADALGVLSDKNGEFILLRRFCSELSDQGYDSIIDKICDSIPYYEPSTSEVVRGGGSLKRRTHEKNFSDIVHTWVPSANVEQMPATAVTEMMSDESVLATVGVGMLLEIASDPAFEDNYFGVCFKVYNPVKIVDGEKKHGRMYWCWGPEELLKFYGVQDPQNPLEQLDDRAVLYSTYEYDFNINEAALSFLRAFSLEGALSCWTRSPPQLGLGRE
ncbi:hypothetical protein CYMTET_28506 [Cymbomonas tetramitiformis]|uniref:Uncharacterized protein n=1 Tax=Cymbomonas tetramitiformis TaxID=36881 RepID=A0AAE0FNC6_9CHLO|nr:hypothetical protein CYMTET_28506 [Cymbomonas tetramitiformis]|eukprot:gene21059-25271_t